MRSEYVQGIEAVGAWETGPLAKSPLWVRTTARVGDIEHPQRTARLRQSAFRVDLVDEKGTALSFSWSGPVDGTCDRLKVVNGQVRSARESSRRNGDALLVVDEKAERRGVFPTRVSLCPQRQYHDGHRHHEIEGHVKLRQ